MKIMIILLTIFILSSGHLSAGRLDDLEKELDNKMDLIEKKFDEKSRKLDEQFANTLKDEWFNVKFKEGKPFFDKPKPVTIPQAPKPKTVKPDATPVIIPVLPPEPVDDKEPPKTPPVIGPTEEEYNIYFDFLGKPVTISLPKKVKTLRLNAVKKNEIASFWQEVSTSPHETTLTQLKAYYQDFLKSDWAFLMLLETMAKEVYPEDVNMQNLYVWFLLIKTGYQARVAYDNENIYLLLPSSTMVYGRT
ncbi:MAG: hypothetical protein KKH98_02775, partial [Spirochaetes bacterium]|nr:hypothetical protein [Spirochaetota bacterium]